MLGLHEKYYRLFNLLKVEKKASRAFSFTG